MNLICPQIRNSDEPFLFALYSTVRAEEMTLVPWDDNQKTAFLQSQFKAQHEYYLTSYPQGSFQLIELDGKSIGRLYLAELDDEIRIIDLTILPEYRGKGFGSEIISDILQKAAKPVRIYLESFNQSNDLFKRFGFHKISDEGVYQLWECREIGNKSLKAIG